MNSISRIFLIIALAFSSINVAIAGGANDKPFSPGEVALHHIADAHTFHVWGDLYLPLPLMMFYAPEDGLTVLPSSASFGIGHHGNGTKAINGYVLEHGVVRRIADKTFHNQTVDITFGHGVVAHNDHGHDAHGHDDGHGHDAKAHKEAAHEESVVMINGKSYALEDRTTFDGGLAGGGITSYYDFSITKNVFTLLMVALLMGWLFLSVAKKYKQREGQAPSGTQGFIEPIFEFIQDEVAKPMIGPKWRKFLPFLMSVFFFILGLNLLGQVPFFPGSGNASGDISVTIVLAVFTFLMINLNGNSHYWQHVFWMPGIPTFVKFILTPVEILGLILKPAVLFIRLFANISAGHIVIVAFVGLIFVLGESGKNLTGAGMGAIASTLLTLFMMGLELLVAFIQAFVFTILSASYIGAAVEEHHDDHH